MARGLAFIKLDALFFVFHRLQQSLSLFLVHLPFLFRLRFRNLACFFRRLLGFFSGALYFSGQFFLRRFGRRRGWRWILAFTFAFTRRRRRAFICTFSRARR